MLALRELLILFGSLAFSLAVVVPFAGTIVRFRAHYNPKGLQLDPEGGVQPHTGPVINSIFAMFARVYRIEGWLGLYKGLMPTFISTAIVILFLLLFLSDSNLRHGAYTGPSTGVLGTLAYSIFAMLVSLPQTIITDRAITTPHKLPWFDLMYALRDLLTRTERRRPWILYMTPGLLATQVSHIAYVVLGLRTVRHLLLPELSQPGFPSSQTISAVRLTIYFVLALASTFVLTPLEVIGIRLAIQRNHAAPEFNSVTQEEEDAEDAVEYAGVDEDVVGLRTEREPYVGMVDCAKRIIDEEGWTALYRAWWLTMLGCLMGAFS